MDEACACRASKIGHIQIQARPLGVKTGQYPNDNMQNSKALCFSRCMGLEKAPRDIFRSSNELHCFFEVLFSIEHFLQSLSSMNFNVPRS